MNLYHKIYGSDIKYLDCIANLGSNEWTSQPNFDISSSNDQSVETLK